MPWPMHAYVGRMMKQRSFAQGYGRHSQEECKKFRFMDKFIETF
jgi:hypothetical protein